jgi:hypothetical protein
MIQRIQSLFLLLAALIAVALFFIPSELIIFTKSNELMYAYTMNPFGVPQGTSAIIYGLFIANLGVFLFSMVAIFQYKNRKRQMKTSRGVLILSVIQMGQLFAFTLYRADFHEKVYTWAAFLPVGSIVFVLLAGIFIKKDEDLVRSADRIR